MEERPKRPERPDLKKRSMIIGDSDTPAAPNPPKREPVERPVSPSPTR